MFLACAVLPTVGPLKKSNTPGRVIPAQAGISV